MSPQNSLQRLDVVNGYVQCPIKGLIDIDLCFYCSKMKLVELDSAKPTITCISPVPKTISSKEKSIQKWLAIIEMANNSGNVAQTCRDYGVSRTVFYRYKHRFEQEGYLSPSK